MAAFQLLIADDEPIVRRGLKNSIDWSALGYNVMGVFSGGHEVIHFLQENTVDVILSDIRMPEGSGLELAEWITRNRPNTDVILLTGYTDYDAARKAVNYSAVKYLINKPLSLDELRSAFRSIAEERSLRLKEQERINRINLQYLRQMLRDGDKNNALLENASLVCVAIIFQMEKETLIDAPVLTTPGLFGRFQGLIEEVGEQIILLYPCAPSQASALKDAALAYIKMYKNETDTNVLVFSSLSELIDLIAQQQTHVAPVTENKLLQAIDLYLEQHLTNKITLNDAARYMHYSTGYFSRKFKEEAKIGFTAYILNKRIDYAKKLLVETDKNISDIANDVGFDEMRHFAQTFKRKTGMTPSAYRRFHPREARGK